MKFVFVHVNKCAGGTLNKFFKEHLFSKSNYEEMHGEVLRPVPNKKNGIYYILFVRDPIDRWISSYFYYKQRQILPYNDLNEFMNNFRTCKSFREQMIRKNLHFWYTLDKYVCLESIHNLYFVGIFEHLHKSIEDLQEKLKNDFNFSYKIIQLDHLHKSRAHKKRKFKLSNDNVKFLKEYLCKSYKILDELKAFNYLPVNYLNCEKEYYY